MFARKGQIIPAGCRCASAIENYRAVARSRCDRWVSTPGLAFRRVNNGRKSLARQRLFAATPSAAAATDNGGGDGGAGAAAIDQILLLAVEIPRSTDLSSSLLFLLFQLQTASSPADGRQSDKSDACRQPAVCQQARRVLLMEASIPDPATRSAAEKSHAGVVAVASKPAASLA